MPADLHAEGAAPAEGASAELELRVPQTRQVELAPGGGSTRPGPRESAAPSGASTVVAKHKHPAELAAGGAPSGPRPFARSPVNFQ